MHTKTDERFDKYLDEKLNLLQQCQREKHLESCSKCEFYIGCNTRLDYVNSVYNSMSKGQSGGFEF